MIFASDFRLRVGDVFTPPYGFNDSTGTRHAPQPFRIVREATAQEYIDHARHVGSNVASAVQASRKAVAFYEVQTD